MITYKTKSAHPGGLPAATIFLDGLLCLSFDDANKCTIGVNNAAGNGHKWKFSIVNLQNRKTILERSQVNTHDPREIDIEVTGGATGGTYVYNGPDNVSIPIAQEYRYNLENSWIDLEGRRGHNKPIANDTNTLWPRFNLNEGLFCARKLSTATFDLRDSNPKPLIKPLGRIALQIVGDIFLDPNNSQSKIEIKLPDMTVSLNNQNRYLIYITNNCASKRIDDIDFPLHYLAFSGAFNGTHGKRGMKTDDQFHLVYHKAPPPTGKTESIIASIEDVPFDSATDRAPCMAIVLGQTRAFNA